MGDAAGDKPGEPVSPTQWALLLHSVPHLGEKGLTRLLRLSATQRLDPRDLLTLSAGDWKRRYDLRPQAAEYLQANRAELLSQSRELARLLRPFPLAVLTVEMAAYPARLERWDDAPPPVLYALGQAALLEPSRFTFTVAASNAAPPASLSRLEEVAGALVGAGGIPVTGHDRPPYQRLALCAQRKNCPAMYVFDRGLREALGPQFDRPPFKAARIRDAVFDAGRDLALSPFRLDDHGTGANNRRRDRLVFALADVVVAADVSPGGSMDSECRRALEQGKPVYVCDGGREGNDALRELGTPPVPPDLTAWASMAAARATG